LNISKHLHAQRALRALAGCEKKRFFYNLNVQVERPAAPTLAKQKR